MPSGKPLVASTARKIAAGKIAGKSNKAIAADAGVSESTVQHAMQSDAVRSMIAEATRREREKLVRGFGVMVDQLIVDLGAAKYAERESAAARLLHLLAIADQAAGITNAAVSTVPAASVMQPRPMTELLQAAFSTTDRVILERTQVNGHLNGKHEEGE